MPSTSDKLMTHQRKERQKRRSKGTARQPELPLAPATGVREKSTAPSYPKSKLIFQLKSELHRLQQRDREWKLMFDMLSHDLKEPILTLEGFTKLLDTTQLDKDQRRYLKIIRESVNSLHALIGSLQSLAKLYHEPQELSELSLKDLLQSVVTSLAEQLQRTKGSIVLPETDLQVRGDAVRLYQIFLNLIANSLKYHRADLPPVITVRFKRGSDFWRVSIVDNGIGIDPEDLKRLFTPFTRLENASTEGMGIGLSIVKRIAESFGGKVTVRSQQNKGTIFTVWLPTKGSAPSADRALQNLKSKNEDSDHR